MELKMDALPVLLELSFVVTFRINRPIDVVAYDSSLVLSELIS